MTKRLFGFLLLSVISLAIFAAGHKPADIQMVHLQDKTKYATVATSLYTFVGPLGSKYNLICAGVIISLLPALVIFITCQKQIYSGLTAGSVKA